MSTVGRHMALTLWMLALLVVTIFATSAHEGWIHDAAWNDACAALESGEAIPGSWNTTNHCH
jgi:hypothetical protein